MQAPLATRARFNLAAQSADPEISRDGPKPASSKRDGRRKAAAAVSMKINLMVAGDLTLIR
jgi:hypothetical protein